LLLRPVNLRVCARVSTYSIPAACRIYLANANRPVVSSCAMYISNASSSPTFSVSVANVTN